MARLAPFETLAAWNKSRTKYTDRDVSHRFRTEPVGHLGAPLLATYLEACSLRTGSSARFSLLSRKPTGAEEYGAAPVCTDQAFTSSALYPQPAGALARLYSLPRYPASSWETIQGLSRRHLLRLWSQRKLWKSRLLLWSLRHAFWSNHDFSLKFHVMFYSQVTKNKI